MRFILWIYRYVSIHAPWEGCDQTFIIGNTDIFSFNSRTLGRVRQEMFRFDSKAKKFQFTHPGKGATLVEGAILAFKAVSIHAPWEGCDC